MPVMTDIDVTNLHKLLHQHNGLTDRHLIILDKTTQLHLQHRHQNLPLHLQRHRHKRLQSQNHRLQLLPHLLQHHRSHRLHPVVMEEAETVEEKNNLKGLISLALVFLQLNTIWNPT